MSGVVKLILILTVLPAHAPVCKMAMVEVCTHPISAPAPHALPPCCAKCAKKSCPTPSAPKPDRPMKPACPPNCLSPLCSVFSAVVSDAVVSAELDQPMPERLPVTFRLVSPDGFHTLLDRPPRA